jgi:proline iminopeptidase
MNRDCEPLLRPALPYPPIRPYDSGFIEVDGGHRIYWEMCGNPRGKPALFLHGGPGGGCSAGNRQLFDPERYRIILFDQRGCGRSTPHARLAANTTAHLIADIETLRHGFGIERWLLLGGSWGAALALAYAQTYPERVCAMVLRGVFTGRRSELRWLYQEGASMVFPDAWQRFVAPIPDDERNDLVAAYHARLTGADTAVAIAAARAWCEWEDRIMTLQPQPDAYPPDHQKLLALAKIEAHYLINRLFIEEGQLIANAHRLSAIPGVIVQGRYDMVTPAGTAWELHDAWPQSDLQIVPDAGHASSEPGNLQRLIMATDAFARM